MSPLLALRQRLPGSLVALDFDGTLAPVVSDPAQAGLAEGAGELLAALGQRVGQLAIVTGRPALFVVNQGGLAQLPGLVVLGQYGAECWQDGELQAGDPLPGLPLARAALAELPPGAVLEDKRTALAVHTRRAPDPAGLLLALRPRLERLAVDTGLECHQGRAVLELRPPGQSKGRALRTLLRPPPAAQPSAVLYAGDDLGDLSAFAVLDGLSIPTVRVCSDSDEAPVELRERADLVVAGPDGLLALLRSLLS